MGAIEDTHERDGEIVVPAGSKAIGKPQQRIAPGFVSLHFDTLGLPDGMTEKMNGSAMGLDFAQVRGVVTGKKRGARFLAQMLTGMGTVAASRVARKYKRCRKLMPRS